MSVVDRLAEDARPIWERIVEHPFVVELYGGELPREKFRFYVLQDYHYLVTAMRNFGLITARAPSVEAMREVVDILVLEARSEFDGYVALLERLGCTLAEAAAVEPIPASVSYGSFLLATSSQRSYAEAITAVLPCFWSYAAIAERHAGKLHDNPVELYRDWGAVYTTDDYRRLVDTMKRLVDAAGEHAPYEKLKDVFIAASRYEYLFWEAVYNHEEWPV